ncbi:hypothetical protein EXN32_11330 [Agrobacterium tumefaciens]|uniref:Riorf25 protein n=2 Tax=Rhizobium/Agrobacterium group TaxID=227290 RepID=Q9F5G7_RHIRH|nr:MULTISPECIES: hypothetical protein [Rhizobium/Agrobacterium group]ASK42904.1 hypothetical protein [Rhizobium rhizogenes]MCZ7976414.1 hypothetical protein [Agrobacterium salinitolerans]MDA5243302.1 hypothetical protein [Agrobacterium sp. MAFF310724]MDA5247516.1 hypothetical protein [Agrobacterium sp. MAFF210268]TRB03201.1 hypothetical protein EXN61_22945 [Agrobacterium tumefaciens]
MQITAVDLYEIRIPYRRNHTLSSGPLHGANSIIIRLSTDEGISGAGEASIPGGAGWSEESASSVRMVIQEYLAPVIIGRDPRNCSEFALAMRKAVRGDPFARAALEMACSDIAGQSIGVPAAQLLGGTQRQTVSIVWSLESGVVDQEIEEALKVSEDFAYKDGCVNIPAGTSLGVQVD